MTEADASESQPGPEQAPHSIQPSAQQAPGGRIEDLDRVMDIPLTLHVELGGRRMKVRELLELGAGAILELDTPAGAPLLIFANETMIAQGEAVVVGERYGVRVTEIVAPAERVRRLSQSGGRR